MLDELVRAIADGFATWPAPLNLPQEERFFVIAGSRGPRWIVPQDPARGWPVLKQWQPYDFISRMKWAGLLQAYRNGVLGAVPGIRSIAWHARNPIPGVKGDDQTNPVIYVGTPSPYRKIVISFVDANTRSIIGVAKAPLATDSRERIAHEGKMLTWLEKERPGLAPRLLHFAVDQHITVQDPVVGALAGKRWKYEYGEVLNDLMISDTLSLSELSEGLIVRIEQENSASAHEKSVLIGAIANNCRRAVPASIVHGDFSPWNIIHQKNGRDVLIDWESSETKGLPLFDIVHYFAIQAYVFNYKRLFTDSVVNVLQEFAKRVGIERTLTTTLIRLALVKSWVSAKQEQDNLQACDLVRRIQIELRDEW